MKRAIHVGAGALLAMACAWPAAASQDRIGVWDCRVVLESSCTIKGCTEMRPNLGRLVSIDFDQSIYRPCDKDDCQTYPAKIIQAGGIAYIDVPDQDLTARMQSVPNGTLFLEVHIDGVVATMAHGACNFRPSSAQP